MDARIPATRRRLPQRRSSATFELNFWGQKFAVGIGYYPDGQIGEVFVSTEKTGGQIEALARDAAILISLALQFGAPLETIQHAVTRDGSGAATSILGAIIDAITTKPFPERGAR